MKGCWFFAGLPNTEANVPVVLRSSRGFQSNVMTGCYASPYGDDCSYYLSLHDRQPGDRECFWLTTTDFAWTQRSNPVCLPWPSRPKH